MTDWTATDKIDAVNWVDKARAIADDVTEAFAGLSAAIDELRICSDNFLQAVASAIKVQPINRPKKSNRIATRHPPRYPKRCRPRPRETPGVNPLLKLEGGRK